MLGKLYIKHVCVDILNLQKCLNNVFMSENLTFDQLLFQIIKISFHQVSSRCKFFLLFKNICRNIKPSKVL